MDVRNKPIGIFDSGIGGLTVAREVMNMMPREDIVYFGDTARVPYGTKSKETVTRFAFSGIRFLLSCDVKMIIVACNTVSATCLDRLQESTPVPVIGVIDPGARAAALSTRNRIVGIIGTERTIKSGAYIDAIHRLSKEIKIYSKPCPLFVPLVEEGWLENKAAFYTASTYLMPLKEEGIDTLVLACTHYPLLKPTLSSVMGNDVKLVDSAYETAKQVKIMSKGMDLACSPEHKASYQYFVSDNPEKFIQVGEKFLGRPINPINVIDPELD